VGHIHHDAVRLLEGEDLVVEGLLQIENHLNLAAPELVEPDLGHEPVADRAGRHPRRKAAARQLHHHPGRVGERPMGEGGSRGEIEDDARFLR
jgi:hypothetical protein